MRVTTVNLVASLLPNLAQAIDRSCRPSPKWPWMRVLQLSFQPSDCCLCLHGPKSRLARCRCCTWFAQCVLRWDDRVHYYLDKVTKLLREFGYVEDPAMLVYQEVCMNVTALDVDHRFFAVMTTSILVAAGHGLAMVLAITRSIHSRQICFEEQSTGPSKLSFYSFRLGSSRLRRWMQAFRRYTRCFHGCSIRIRGCYRWIAHLFVSHPTVVVLLLAMIEVACQTSQAYRMSFYIDSPWINRMFIIATCVHCWSSTIIYLLFRRSPIAQRVIAMVVDALLNALQSVVIPWTILYPYFRDSTRQSISLKGTRYESPLGIVPLNYNTQQLFPSS